jgi:hypothetical protein
MIRFVGNFTKQNRISLTPKVGREHVHGNGVGQAKAQGVAKAAAGRNTSIGENAGDGRFSKAFIVASISKNFDDTPSHVARYELLSNGGSNSQHPCE